MRSRTVQARASLLATASVALFFSAEARATPSVDTLTTGPSSSASPYLVPTASGWTASSVISAGDAVPYAGRATSYIFPGTPDGLGAFDNGNGTITVLANHEFSNTRGARGIGGTTGSLVSQLVVDKNTLQVLSGRELVNTAGNFNVTGAQSLDRLCSADLPVTSAFYNAATGTGYAGRIFMNGEETAGGRALGWVVAENSVYQLPALGAFAHENALANPNTGDKTVVVGTDDTTGGKLYVYAGTKQNAGTAVDKAGLTNGTNYQIKVNGVDTEDRTTNVGIAKSLVGQGAGQSFSLVADGSGTGFLRPEDGAWDTKDPNRFFFATTDRYDEVKDGVGTQIGRSRLWEIDFTDASNPTLGGQVRLLLDGTEQGNMFDNITVDADGNILLQEDVGNQLHNGKIYVYDRNTGALTQVLQHDVARFGNLNSPNFSLTRDEESSGIIDVTDLFRSASWYAGGKVFLATDQAHYPLGGNLVVEGGQLLLFTVPEPATATLLFGGLMAAVHFRRRQIHA